MKSPQVLMPRWRCQSYVHNIKLQGCHRAGGGGRGMISPPPWLSSPHHFRSMSISTNSFYTHIIIMFALINFVTCRQNPESQGLKVWVMIDHDCMLLNDRLQKVRVWLNQQSLASLFSLCSYQ